MDPAAPRVFVSSTFEDLNTYRDAVRDAITIAGATPVLIEDELIAGASISETVAELLQDADAVLLLIGYRYGSLEPGESRSWVELEYENAKRLGKPVLAFMAAADAPWPPKYVDADRTRIEAFRNKVSSDIVVKLFRDEAELRREVALALTRWVRASRKSVIEVASPQSKKREVRIVRLLLSSPGDVADERDRVASAVFRFNQDAVEEFGLFVKLMRWEDMAPQIGPKPQAVINKQIGPYHLFAGIMWNRFGTPTEIAASGTIEEFNAAVSCWKSMGQPWITFYFCDRPATFSTPEQLDQKRRVLEFRAELHNMGVVRAYQASQEFEDRFFDDLKRITRLPEFLTLLERDA